MMKKLWKQTKGEAAILTPFLFLMACLALYAVIKYSPAYLTYFQIKQAFSKTISKSSTASEQDFRNELNYNMQTLEKPFKMEDIAITRVGDTIIIDVLYEVKIEHPFMQPQIIKFNPHVEKPVPKSSLN